MQAAPLLQAPQLLPMPYSARNTYVAIVASDGDNMQACASLLRCMLLRIATLVQAVQA